MSDDRPVRDVNDMMEPEAGSRISFGAVIALVALVVFVVFVVQNLAEGTVTLLWKDVAMPVWLLAVIVFALGFIVGYFAKTRRVRRKRKIAAAKVG